MQQKILEASTLSDRRTLTIDFPIEPVAKGRHRFSRSGHAYTPGRTRSAEALFREFLRRELDRSKEVRFEGAIGIIVCFLLVKPKTASRTFPSVRPDQDNFQKLIQDALNEVLWEDDSQIVDARVLKRYANSPGVILSVYEYRAYDFDLSSLPPPDLGDLTLRDRALSTSSSEVSNPSQDSSEVVSTPKRKRKKSQQVQE